MTESRGEDEEGMRKNKGVGFAGSSKVRGDRREGGHEGRGRKKKMREWEI